MQATHLNRNFHIIFKFMLYACILILVWGAIRAVAFQYEAIIFRYPLDYGEAPLINQAAQMNAGNPIYRNEVDQAPYTITNYPPVYLLFLAFFEFLIGPAFWYGRLLSSLSAIGSGVILSLMSYSRSRKISIALIPGLLFLNLPYVVSWSILARIDHLALFFALLGLYFLFRQFENERLVTPSLLLGSLFLIIAIFTRQSYALAAPFAGFVFLLQKSWKRAFLLAAIVGGMTLLLFLGLNIVTQGGFYFNIVTANVNPYDINRTFDNFRNFFDHAPLIFILAVVGLSVSITRVEGWPLMFGLLVGGFLSALTIGKIGSNINYFLEFAAALCLLIGFGLVILEHRSNQMLLLFFACLLVFLLTWQTVLLIKFVQEDSRLTLQERQHSLDDLKNMEVLIKKNIDRPILADEYMGMILLAGQNLYLQPFEITQFINAGLFDQNILIDQIQDAHFSLILIQEGSFWSFVAQERWTPELLDAIRLNYRLIAQLENTHVYQPHKSQSIDTPISCPKDVWDLPTMASLGYQYHDGILILYGAGVEGRVPVKAVADGRVYRPRSFPDGSLILVHDDPFQPGEQVIVLFDDMRSYRGTEIYIPDEFPVGAAGILVRKGEVIGYQGMWSGTPMKQDWLHVNLGVAPYDQAYLSNFDLLKAQLVNPDAYFGVIIDANTKNIRPIECLP